jgi:hypothetical protein
LCGKKSKNPPKKYLKKKTISTEVFSNLVYTPYSEVAVSTYGLDFLYKISMSGVDKWTFLVLVDTGEKCATGVADTGGKYAAAVNKPRTGDRCKS